MIVFSLEMFWGIKTPENVFSLHDGKHFQENALRHTIHTESSQFAQEALSSLDITMLQPIVLSFR